MGQALRPGQLGDLFWRVDDLVLLLKEGRPVAWNPAAERTLGIPAEQVLAKGFDLGVIFGDALARFQELVTRDTASARLDCTAGCERTFDALIWQLTVEDLTAVLLRDVTARTRLTAGLARLSALGRDLLASEPSVPDLLQRLADEAKAVTGAAFSSLMLVRPGLPREVTHFAYNAPRELFPERLPRVVGLLEAAMSAGGPVRLADIRGAAGGVGIPVKHPPIAALLAVPVIAGNVLMGLVAVANRPDGREFDETDESLVVDLAAHTGTAVRWAQAREAAAAVAAERREAIAVAKHDIQNPLAAGKGYAHMLVAKSDRMSEQMKVEAYGNLARVFARLEEFTDRLFLQEGESAVVEPRWEDVVLSDLLERIEADRAASARPEDGPLRIEVEQSVGSLLRADLSLARQALDNLIGNAYKHGDSGHEVTVTVRPEGEHVRFDVHNTGDGIPASEQHLVFDRHWRSARTQSRGTVGSGLGLSIVRDIANTHGGVVGVSSRPDEGTTFWITFPR